MSATPRNSHWWSNDFFKRAVKLVISIGCFGVMKITNAARRVFGNPTPGTAVVLYYHDVPGRFAARFEEQMRALLAVATPVSVMDLDHLPPASHSVAVTFDDGLESFAEHGVPVLEKLGIPATLFAVAGLAGVEPKWGVTYYGYSERLMTREQLLSLPATISIGSHTLTHANLAEVNDDTAEREIRESRQRLEEILQRPVTLFCFPYGALKRSCISQCREAGYTRVFTTSPELLGRKPVGFSVGRVAADPWDWKPEFRLKLQGAYCWQAYVSSFRDRVRDFLLGRSPRQADVSVPEEVAPVRSQSAVK